MSIPAAVDAAGSRFTFDEPALTQELGKHLRIQQDLVGGGYILIHKVGDLYYTGSVVRPGCTTVVAKERTLAVLLTALQTVLDGPGVAG